MATEVGDLNIIQDEDLLRRMWQQTEDFSRKKEIRQRMYKLREERLKSYYITRESTNTTGGTEVVTGGTITHHKPAVSSHAESFANQGFLAMKSKEIRDSASSPTIEFCQQSSANQYRQNSGNSTVEQNSSQQRSSRTSKHVSSSTSSYSNSGSYDQNGDNVCPGQTYAITYELDTKPSTESQNTSYSTSSSTQKRYSSTNRQQENTAKTTTSSSSTNSHQIIDNSNVADSNDQIVSNGNFSRGESIKYSTSTNGEIIHPVSRENSNLCEITRKTFRENSNLPSSRSVSRENSNLYKTTTGKRTSVDEKITKTSSSSSSNRSTKNTVVETTEQTADNNVKNEQQFRSKVSVNTSATHNAFASSLRASPDRGTPSPTIKQQSSSSRSSVERSTPEISPLISPEKSYPVNDLSKKYTASFQHRINTSSTHLKSKTSSSNPLSSTSEYESDESNVLQQKHPVLTTDDSSTITKTTNVTRIRDKNVIKSPDSSPERVSAFRPIVTTANTNQYGRKQTDITPQPSVLKTKPVQSSPKVASGQPSTNITQIRPKPDSVVGPSKKSPTETPKPEKTKPDETIPPSASETADVTDTNVKSKTSVKVPAGKKRSATCNSFTTPSTKGKPAKTNYSSGSSESSSTESDSDLSSDDERQEVTIEEVVDDDDETVANKVTNGDVDQNKQMNTKTNKIVTKESTEKLITCEKGSKVTKQPQTADVKDQTRSFIEREKKIEASVQPEAEIKMNVETAADQQSECIRKVVQTPIQSRPETESCKITEQKSEKRLKTNVPSQSEIKTNIKTKEQSKKTKSDENHVKIPDQTRSVIKIGNSDVKNQTEKCISREKIEKTVPTTSQSDKNTKTYEIKTSTEKKERSPLRDKSNTKTESKIIVDVKVDTATKKGAKSTTKEIQNAKTPAAKLTVKQPSFSSAKPDDKKISKQNTREKIKLHDVSTNKKPTKRASESSIREKQQETNKNRLDSAHKAKSEALIKSVKKPTVATNAAKPTTTQSSPVTPKKQKTIVTETVATTVDNLKTTKKQPKEKIDESSVQTTTIINVEQTNSMTENTTNPMISSVNSDQFCHVSDNDLIPRLADQITSPDDAAELVKKQKFEPQRLEITDLDDEAEGVCNVSVNERKHQFLENAKDALTTKKLTVVEGNLIQQREQGVTKTKELFENIAKNQKPHSPEFRRRLLREPIEEEAAEVSGAADVQHKTELQERLVAENKTEVLSQSPERGQPSVPLSPTSVCNVAKIKSTFEVGGDVVAAESQTPVRVPLMRQTSLKKGTNLIDQLDSTNTNTVQCSSSNITKESKLEETVIPTQTKSSPSPKEIPSSTKGSKAERKSSPIKDNVKQTSKSNARSPSPPKKTTTVKKETTKTTTTTSTSKQTTPITPKPLEVTQVEVKPKKRVYEHTTIAKVDSYPVKETITVSDARKSPEKNATRKTTTILTNRKSTSPEKILPKDVNRGTKSNKIVTESKDRKSKSPEKRPTKDNAGKSTDTTIIFKDRKSVSPEKRPAKDTNRTLIKTATVSSDRKSVSPEKRTIKTTIDSKTRKSSSPEKRTIKNADSKTIKTTNVSETRKSKSPEKRPTKESNRKSISPVKETCEKTVSASRTKFEETATKRQLKKSPSPTKDDTTSSRKETKQTKTSISSSRPSPERKTTNTFETTGKTVRKSPERISATTCINFGAETSYNTRSNKRTSPEKTTTITRKRVSPEKTISTTNKRTSPEKTTVVTVSKKSSPFGVTLRNVKSSTVTTKSSSVFSTKRETETTEINELDADEKKIEEIFDLELLEQMLEKAVKYDIRSRIRAQIRLIKRQREQSKRVSRTPSPEKSPSKETKKSINDSKITEYRQVDGSDRRNLVKTTRLFNDENTNTNSFSSSVTAATQSSNLHKVSKNENVVPNTQKVNYQNDRGSKCVTDSIISSYGVGPTDQDGKLLFGLKALRTSNDSKSNLTDSHKITSNVNSETSSRVYSFRSAMQSDSAGNVTIQRQEVKGELHSENGKEPIGTVTNTQYSYNKPSRGEATVKTKTTTDVLDAKNVDAAFKTKLGTGLIRKISNEHFETAQRKFNGEKCDSETGKKFTKIDENESAGNETYTTSTSRHSYQRSSVTKGEKDDHFKIRITENDDDDDDASKDTKNKFQQATLSSSMKQVAKSKDNETGKNFDSDTTEFDESGTSVFETSQRFESRSSSSSFACKNYENGVQNRISNKIERNNDTRSEYNENKTGDETNTTKFVENSISLRDLDRIPKTSSSSYTVTIKSSSNTTTTPFKRQSSNIKRNKEINIEQIWDEDQLRDLLETCPDSELRSRIAAKLRTIMAENKNKEVSATTSISGKNDIFSSDATKVHTSRITSSSGRMVKEYSNK